jgi:hypothetical protein
VMMTRRVFAVLPIALAMVGCTSSEAPVASARLASNVTLQTAVNAPVALSVAAAVDEAGAPSGSWTEEIAAGVPITAEVSCYTARGDDIWLGGTITSSAQASLIGSGASLRLQRGAGGSFATSYTILSASPGCDAANVPLVQLNGAQSH